MKNKLTYKSDAERIQFCHDKQIELKDHCCLDMAWFISEPLEYESQGPNPVILYIASHREYRIDISHRGNSSTLINYCPWCGEKLPSALTKEWYDTLYKLGFTDPSEQDVPDKFNSDAWWKEKVSNE